MLFVVTTACLCELLCTTGHKLEQLRYDRVVHQVLAPYQMNNEPCFSSIFRRSQWYSSWLFGGQHVMLNYWSTCLLKISFSGISFTTINHEHAHYSLPIGGPSEFLDLSEMSCSDRISWFYHLGSSFAPKLNCGYWADLSWFVNGIPRYHPCTVKHGVREC